MNQKIQLNYGREIKELRGRIKLELPALTDVIKKYLKAKQ